MMCSTHKKNNHIFISIFIRAQGKKIITASAIHNPEPPWVTTEKIQKRTERQQLLEPRPSTSQQETSTESIEES